MYYRQANGSMSLSKTIRHAGRDFGGVVNRHRQKESLVFGHVQHSSHREIPFAAKITLAASIGTR
jgi:hypothetical protein